MTYVVNESCIKCKYMDCVCNAYHRWGRRQSRPISAPRRNSSSCVPCSTMRPASSNDQTVHPCNGGQPVCYRNHSLACHQRLQARLDGGLDLAVPSAEVASSSTRIGASLRMTRGHGRHRIYVHSTIFLRKHRLPAPVLIWIKNFN